MDDFPPIELTEGEKWLIARLRSDESQEEFALRLGIHRRTYQRVEYGAIALPWPTGLALPDGAHLSPLEFCVIVRKRLGYSQFQLADLMSMSRISVCRMEGGKANPARLYEFWREHIKFLATKRKLESA